jgi:hypothetical protein
MRVLGCIAIGLAALGCATRPNETSSTASAITDPVTCPRPGSVRDYDAALADAHIGTCNESVSSAPGDGGTTVEFHCICTGSGVACASNECPMDDSGVLPEGCCACPASYFYPSGPIFGQACVCPPEAGTPETGPPPSGCNNPNGVGEDRGKCKGHFR